jgi:phosphoenolpyruvate phosphomutase
MTTASEPQRTALPPETASFRQMLEKSEAPIKLAGAHDALGAVIAEEVGFDGIWASSLGISAARCIPDASLLTMTDYLDATENIQKAASIPVAADCDTGFGSSLNVAHMVHEYQAAGITAVCIEDKVFPKVNSFVSAEHALCDTRGFCHKLEVAKTAQQGSDFFIIARTEAMISGLGVDEGLRRCHAYAEAGADAVLVHSKQATNHQIVEFLEQWDARLPVVIVPTTYPDWDAAAAAAAGVSVVIYAIQGLRATVSALRSAYTSIQASGASTSIEEEIAPLTDIFRLQRVREWLTLDAPADAR